MGNIFRLFYTNSQEVSKSDLDVFVDFENCKPSAKELPLWQDIQNFLNEAPQILDLLRNYPGAAQQIRLAITNSSDRKAQDAAWQAIQPLVRQSKICYDFAIQLAPQVSRLLATLCAGDGPISQNLEENQALFKQFAEVFEFILEFDSLKMMQPSVQNDLSFYRRMLANSLSGRYRDMATEISSDTCNELSLFYAESTPMLKLISRSTVDWKDEDNRSIQISRLMDLLASMAHICRSLLQKPQLRIRLTREATRLLCLRVMTGVIILYDHVDPSGVFAKKAKLDVKSCLQLLKDQNDDIDITSGLLNAIKNSAIHLKDDSTPKNVKQMLTTAC